MTRLTPGSLPDATVHRIADALAPKVAALIATAHSRNRRTIARDVVVQVVADLDLILSGAVPIEELEARRDATVALRRPGHEDTITLTLPRPQVPRPAPDEFPGPGRSTLRLLEPCDGPGGPPLTARQLRRWWWRR